MITPVVQRWRARRDAYRPAGETIDTRAHEVAAIPDDRTAKAFVLAHHYSASYPAARWRFGLFRGAELLGVAVFSVPANDRALACFRGPATELGRFVLLDSVAANGETWFLARCLDELRRKGLAGVVSFSDPAPRTRADGSVAFGGHVGTIYQASSAVYLGRSKAEPKRLFADGATIHNRALAKIRDRSRGWEYAAALLERAGADPLGTEQDPRAWLARWLPALTRPIKHPGNHKYAIPLERAARRALPQSLPYPKFAA